MGSRVSFEVSLNFLVVGRFLIFLVVVFLFFIKRGKKNINNKLKCIKYYMDYFLMLMEDILVLL